MKTIRMLCVAVLGLLILGLLLRSITIKIKPGEAGVLNAEWTVGLVERDFGPGYHWDIGPLHTWRVIDTTVQTIQMNESREAVVGDTYPPLKVKSADGADVLLDVTLKFRIKPGEAWRTLVLGRYKEKVRNEAIDIMRPALGRLTTEEFYDPTRRQAVTADMEQSLQSRFNDLHVDLVNILIRNIRFDAAFEENIKGKTLAQQDALVAKAQTEAEKFRGLTNEITAQTEAKVTVIKQKMEKTLIEMRAENDKKIEALRAEYRKNVAEIESDADLYAALKDAEGVKLLREAEARGEELRRTALAGVGGQVLAAMELAKSLRFGDITVSTIDANPLDVEKILERFGLKRGTAEAAGAGR